MTPRSGEWGATVDGCRPSTLMMLIRLILFSGIHSNSVTRRSSTFLCLKTNTAIAAMIDHLLDWDSQTTKETPSSLHYMVGLDINTNKIDFAPSVKVKSR